MIQREMTVITEAEEVKVTDAFHTSLFGCPEEENTDKTINAPYQLATSTKAADDGQQLNNPIKLVNQMHIVFPFNVSDPLNFREFPNLLKEVRSNA